VYSFQNKLIMVLDNKTIMALIPLVIIQLILIIVCVIDWNKREKFKNLNKWFWLIVILFVNIIGPILYLTFGRDNDNN